MEKIIIVVYVDIRNRDDVFEYIQDIKNSIKQDGIIHYIVPIQGENKIECINPRLVSPDEFKKAQDVLDDLNKNIKSVIDRWFNGVRIQVSE